MGMPVDAVRPPVMSGLPGVSGSSGTALWESANRHASDVGQVWNQRVLLMQGRRVNLVLVFPWARSRMERSGLRRVWACVARVCATRRVGFLLAQRRRGGFRSPRRNAVSSEHPNQPPERKSPQDWKSVLVFVASLATGIALVAWHLAAADVVAVLAGVGALYERVRK